ncbi:MAG: histidine kinase, partial [Microvirga sp.]
MADYYPLLTRALDALTERSPAMRRAVYDRARAALMDQLRNLEPPLSEGDIARERLALEDAVNRVESEQRRRESFADVISTAVLEPAGARPAPEPPPPPAPPPPDEEARPPFRPPTAMPDPAVEEREPADRGRLGEPGPRERPRIDTVSPRVAPSGRGRTAILAAALAVAIGLIAAAAYVLRDRPADLPRQPVVA